METKTQKPMIRIQSCGWCNAKPAGELSVDDRILWNFGYTSTVIEVFHKGKSVYTKIKSDDSGKVFERRFLRSRLIAYV